VDSSVAGTAIMLWAGRFGDRIRAGTGDLSPLQNIAPSLLFDGDRDSFPGGYSIQGVKLTTPLHPVPEVKNEWTEKKSLHL